MTNIGASELGAEMTTFFAPPLKCAEDAVVVDTSDMTPEQAVEFIKNKIQEKSEYGKQKDRQGN